MTGPVALQRVNVIYCKFDFQSIQQQHFAGFSSQCQMLFHDTHGAVVCQVFPPRRLPLRLTAARPDRSGHGIAQHFLGAAQTVHGVVDARGGKAQLLDDPAGLAVPFEV